MVSGYTCLTAIIRVHGFLEMTDRLSDRPALAAGQDHVNQITLQCAPVAMTMARREARIPRTFLIFIANNLHTEVSTPPLCK